MNFVVLAKQNFTVWFARKETKRSTNHWIFLLAEKVEHGGISDCNQV